MFSADRHGHVPQYMLHYSKFKSGLPENQYKRLTLKTGAVICELNPLHNGHARLFRLMKEEHGCDFAVAVMSGNYVQRGAPAVMDKFTRARAALLCGADLVIELPQLFSICSAGEFAKAGVAAAIASGCDILAFGAEHTDILSPDGIYRGSAAGSEAERSAATENAETAEAAGLTAGVNSAAVSAANDKASAIQTVGFNAADVSAANDKASAVRTAGFNAAGVNAAVLHTPDNRIINGCPSKLSAGGLFTDYRKITASDAFSTALRDFLKSGMNYPAARLEALRHSGFSAEACSFLSEPNNILALEYIEAISYFSHDSAPSIRPVMIDRSGDPFSAETPSDAAFTSASALRKQMLSDAAFSYAQYVPEAAAALYAADDRRCFMDTDDFSGILSHRLLSGKWRSEDFSSFYDVSPEIANRLADIAELPLSFSERAARLKTRQYTYTRISRALMHIALDISCEEAEAYKSDGFLRCLRVLGFRRDAAELLHAVKKNCSVPMVTKAADFKELLKNEIYRDNLYYAALAAKYGCAGEAALNEYTRQLVIV